MKIDDIIDLIEENSPVCIELRDTDKNRLGEFNPEHHTITGSEWFKKMAGRLSDYNKIFVFSTSMANRRANGFRHADRWICNLSNMSDQVNPGINGNGINTNIKDLLAKERELMEAKMELKMLQQQQTQEMSPKDWITYLPTIIDKLSGQNNQGAPMVHTVPQQMAVPGSQLGNNNSQASNDVYQRIEDLINSLDTKIGANKIVILLDALDKKPEAADTLLKLI